MIALPTRIAGVDDSMYYHPASEDAIVHAETLKAHRAIGWSTPTATPTNKQQMRGFSAALTFSTTIQPPYSHHTTTIQPPYSHHTTTIQPPHNHHATTIRSTKDGPPSSSAPGSNRHAWHGVQRAHPDPLGPFPRTSTPRVHIWSVLNACLPARTPWLRGPVSSSLFLI